MNKNYNIEIVKTMFIYLLFHKDNNSETYDNIKNYCQNCIRNDIRGDVPQIIEKVISKYYHIPIKTLQSKTLKRKDVQARQTEMYFARKYTKLSLAKIGQRFGLKDHGTVLHAIKTINNLIDTDKNVRKDINEITMKIKYKL